MKKEVKKSRNVGKIWGYVAGVGEFENRGKSPGAPKKGPIFLIIGNVLSYVVSRCCRGDWYVWLRNVGEILQHVVSTRPS